MPLASPKPLVSIIIPTWNHGRELIACLKSLEVQTYRPFEVTIVDDASTDETADLLTHFRAGFPMTVISLTARSGAPVARNAGAKQAKGEYLLFVDADEVLRPHAIERMAVELERHPDAAFAYPSFRFGWKFFRSRSFNVKALQTAPYIHTTALMRKAAFPGFDETLKKFQDWDLWLTIAERGGKGVWIPEELFTVNVRREGMSRWLPKIVYRVPWPVLGWTPSEILKYRQMETVVKEKHGIRS